jgi:putative insertion element HTH domain-containing protein
MRLKRTRQEKAAILVAEDYRTDEQIAQSLGVTRKTLGVWKKKPAFKARVEEIAAELCEKALKEGISRRERRLAVQNEAHNKLLTIIAERATDPELQAIPGGKTGLVCKTIKGIGKGEDFRVVEQYQTDTDTIKAILAIHEQTAKELGQVVERHEVADVSREQFKTDEELQVELMQILAKRHTDKQTDKPGDAPC